jgi:hypothetical protein
MIDFGKILKRAWHILWNYKILWIFGILLVLFANSGSSGGNSSFRYSVDNNGRGFDPGTNPNFQRFAQWLDRSGAEMNQWFQQNVEPLVSKPAEHVGTFLLIGLGLLLLILFAYVIKSLVRYPAEAAAIRMVNEYEESGEKVGFRQGWKLGWTSRAFRMWWIDFLLQDLWYWIGGLFMAVSLWQVIANAISNDRAGTLVWVTVLVSDLFLMIGLSILPGIFVRLLRQFIWRQVVLENAGTKQAFRQGWKVFAQRWDSAVVMWLILAGIKIGFAIALAIGTLLLIPVFLLLLLPGAVVAAIPGLIAYAITNIFTTTIWALLAGIVVAAPVLGLIVSAPLTLINGWYMIYDSSAWTLAYREIKAFNAVAPLEPVSPETPPEIAA